jgi:enoyl-CoA hydratase
VLVRTGGPERAGLGNALRYLLTGEEFNAETALRPGFVQEVVAPGSERQPAIEIATLISNRASALNICRAFPPAREAWRRSPRHHVAAGMGDRRRRLLRGGC